MQSFAPVPRPPSCPLSPPRPSWGRAVELLSPHAKAEGTLSPLAPPCVPEPGGGLLPPLPPSVLQVI